ncbi:TspO/MBR related protein [Salsuginibacillus halophilus]|uniref:TspO/MBR related protein n=1 Tax=Salsuginibacillus halophilus TaxID=517424 RepID=A0A2P8HBH6_9BACI|nr:tryptophan-rich sensory protein [Salsuginibacillus halophilus]PSL43572.1 TspO/MBR related protein [Salsuginibacillus halophilus]
MREWKLPVINAVTLAVVVIMNALSNLLPFNNQTVGEISDRLNVLFTPAGYVFSIWSLIYVLLAIWVVRQFVTQAGRESAERVGFWFLISSVFNVSWLVLFHYELFTATMVVMTLLLLSLIIIYRRLDTLTGRKKIDLLPFSVYIGWISVAFIVNIGVVLRAQGIDGWIISGELWTIVALVLGVVLALLFSTTFSDIVYPLVFIWAYIGISVERFETYPLLAVTASFLAGVLALGVVLSSFQRSKQHRKTSG